MYLPGTTILRMLPVASSTMAVAVVMRIVSPAKRRAWLVVKRSRSHQLLRQRRALWTSAINRKNAAIVTVIRLSGSLIGLVVLVANFIMVAAEAMVTASRPNLTVCSAVADSSQNHSPDLSQNHNPNHNPNHSRQEICVISQHLWAIALSMCSSGTIIRLWVAASSSTMVAAGATIIASIPKRTALRVALQA